MPQVEGRDQARALFCWVLVVLGFLNYACSVLSARFQQRMSPAQSVAYLEGKEAPELQRFPNVVSWRTTIQYDIRPKSECKYQIASTLDRAAAKPPRP